MEQGIGLVVAEMPHATDFQLHIFAALAQEERRLISERTRNALAEAKRRGVQLGKNGKALAITNKNAALLRSEELRSSVLPLVDAGLSLGAIAAHLNQSGFRTANGCMFSRQQVRNLVSRLRLVL